MGPLQWPHCYFSGGLDSAMAGTHTCRYENLANIAALDPIPDRTPFGGHRRHCRREPAGRGRLIAFLSIPI
jgi:hypothetical protein